MITNSQYLSTFPSIPLFKGYKVGRIIRPPLLTRHLGRGQQTSGCSQSFKVGMINQFSIGHTLPCVGGGVKRV